MKKKIIIFILISIILIVLSFFLSKSLVNKEDDKEKINDSKNFKIVNNVNTRDDLCLTALDYFYEDEEYRYYFPCIMSHNIYLEYEDGKKVTLKDALKEKLITIKDLDDAGISYNKEKIASEK